MADIPKLPQNVMSLVIAAREAFDTGMLPDDEQAALDKALEPFASAVPYENEPTRAAQPAMDREAVEFLGMVSRLTHSGDDGWTPDDADDATHALDGLIAKARTIANAAPLQSDASIWDSYRLPCDVHLAPVTIIRAGCQLSTLKLAMEVPHRPRHFEGHPNAALSTLSADAMRQGEGWQSIETAPRDGTWFIADGGGLDRPTPMKWCERVGAWEADAVMLEDWDQQAEGYSRPLFWFAIPDRVPASHASDGGKA